MEQSTACDVALVGRRCDDNSNLGLDYLRGAAGAAGLRAAVLPLNRWQDLEPVARQVVRSAVGLVGLSLADGGSAYLPLALGDLLRRRGYVGHITCGGQFATLARRWLLSRYGWLDSVVRFAGEVPLVALARRLGRGQGVDALPGLTTRQGDGLPAPLDHHAPLSTMPQRDEQLPRVLGHAAAHVAASRGCPGRCAYCGPAALAHQEQRERRATPGCAEPGGVRRRGLDHLCDELATLWHQRDVRYVYFVDEHLLPWDHDQALDFVRALGRGLRRRKVGRLGLGAMLRCDRLSPELLDALADVGLVRVFLGLEFATEQEARSYGRRARRDRLPGLLSTLRRRGVATVSNLMLVHPDSSCGSVRAGLAFLGRLPADQLAFEVNDMRAYHGTRLQQRLQRQGRLTGNPLRHGYTFDDQRVARFAEIFARLRAEAFADYSVALRSHDAHLALALARRLHPGARLAPLQLRLGRASQQIQRLYLTALGAGLELAEAGLDVHQVQRLVHEAALGARALVGQLDSIQRDLPAATRAPRRAFSPMRAAAAGALQFVMAGALACSPPVLDQGARPRARTAVMQTRTVVQGDHPPRACTPAIVTTQKKAVRRRVRKARRCFDGSIDLTAAPPRVHVRAGFQLRLCADPAMQKLLKAKVAAVRKVVEAVPHDCLRSSHVVIAGGDGADRKRMRRAVDKTCKGAWHQLWGVKVVLDRKGRVKDVLRQAGRKPRPAAVRCIRRALRGLRFPCLAGYRICTEHVIVE